MSLKLSTRSRYGIRLLLDMAIHGQKGPVQLSDIARRQEVSVKYLEQIIIPLKKAGYIKSLRGPKGGHVLARPPERITVGEVVALLEEGEALTECATNAGICNRAETCPTRLVWKEASEAMFNKLNTITLADLVAQAKASQPQENENVL